MRILFVCAGNSVRSQMAEGWARWLAGDHIEVKSAGLIGQGVHPTAVKAMLAEGIDISRHGSQPIDDKLIEWADYVITLSNAVKPLAPRISRLSKHRHWPVKNPDAGINSNDSQLEAYGRTRDVIRKLVMKFLEEIT